MVILDATIVTVALPSLGRDLGSSLAGLQWFMVNLPIGVLALWMTRRHVTATSKPPDAAGIDPVGRVAAVASLGGLILALIQGGEQG